MPLTVYAAMLACVLVSTCSAEEDSDHISLLQTKAVSFETRPRNHKKTKAAKSLIVGAKGYGDKKCQCVGIEGLTSFADVTVDNKIVVDLYPAEIGSYCAAWDEAKYPGSCDGDKPEDWCTAPWCYVDPCDCDLETNPSPSDILDGATYEGKQIFYSYATCGGKNTYEPPPAKKIEEECARPYNTTAFGMEKCPCVGINGLSGTTDVVVDSETYKDLYPADIGSACAAWDDGKFPGKCDVAKPEKWCSNQWCYVSSENCVLPKGEEGPFPSDYLAHGKFQGKPLMYSYVTCGGVNTYDS